MRGITVLSLFDGIACGYEALKRTNIPVKKYFASEVDKWAISVALDNHPEIVQLGDVKTIDTTTIPKIDLLIGGSPCQGFSRSGKGLNFEDSRSKLFFEYVRLMRVAKPKYFLLENVKMKQEWQDIISQLLGVKPIEINSCLLSAQNRTRLYWTNIPGITLPKDKGIMIDDILECKTWEDGRKLNKATILGRRLNENGHRKDYDKTVAITQCLEVRRTNTQKVNCLTTVEKDNVLTPLSVGRHENAFSLPFRYHTVKEYCRLQTLPDNYTKSVSESQAKKMLGNGWTVEVIAHIFSFLQIQLENEYCQTRHLLFPQEDRRNAE